MVFKECGDQKEMTDKVEIKVLASEAIKILESLAMDSFEANKGLMNKIIGQINIPRDYQEQIMDRLEYFVKELIKVESGKS